MIYNSFLFIFCIISSFLLSIIIIIKCDNVLLNYEEEIKCKPHHKKLFSKFFEQRWMDARKELNIFDFISSLDRNEFAYINFISNNFIC